ncbi:hypothetical protein P5485_013025 [Bacillus pumilus]|uniref:hypothetical protein n=1 Tax=Bacillus TaxID=1386 RepID=UPI000AB2C787|nr:MULTISPECIES: hypothetical protein [Bacillus]MCW4679959.1 hypothetical protein [Bacillus pumilus]MDH3152322.1 hypothetical protein [Bacillus pumilus]
MKLNNKQQRQIIERMNDFGERGVKSDGADKEAVAGMATLLWMLQVLNIDMDSLKEEAR